MPPRFSAANLFYSAVCPQPAQIAGRVLITAADMSIVRKLRCPLRCQRRQNQRRAAAQIGCFHLCAFQLCPTRDGKAAAAARYLRAQGCKTLRAGKAVLKQSIVNVRCSLRREQHGGSQRRRIRGKAR